MLPEDSVLKDFTGVPRNRFGRVAMNNNQFLIHQFSARLIYVLFLMCVFRSEVNCICISAIVVSPGSKREYAMDSVDHTIRNHIENIEWQQCAAVYHHTYDILDCVWSLSKQQTF